MTVRDAATTRIKARDAEKVMLADYPLNILTDLGQERGFQALGALRVNRQRDFHPWAIAWGRSMDDLAVIDVYVKALARTAAPQWQAGDGVVILGIHEDGVAEIATWGASSLDCRRLGDWGALILKELPAAPFQTWFGWGNGGVPKKLTDTELASLSEGQRAFVERYTHANAA